MDAWFESYDNPQKPLAQAVRDVVLAADDRVTEAIKWKAPTFIYEGNIASFYPKAKQHVSLMFHQGASLPDPAGLLEGEGDTSRPAGSASTSGRAAAHRRSSNARVERARRGRRHPTRLPG